MHHAGRPVTAPDADAAEARRALDAALTDVHDARAALLSLVARCPEGRIAAVLTAIEAAMDSARRRAGMRNDPDVMRRFYVHRLAARQAVARLRLGDRRAGRRALDRYIAAEEARAEREVAWELASLVAAAAGPPGG
jgi:hypothetical protein